MNSNLFSLIKSKSFIGGFIVGVFITTVAAIEEPPSPFGSAECGN
jgi:hypothetical protein